MAEPSMPAAIVNWMNDRNWGWHHLEWHTVRQWDLMMPSQQSWALAQGWSRASKQEGRPGNGLEFLVMHRAMIELLRENFPAHVGLLVGWSAVPTNPNSVSDPMPANGQPRVFSANMQTSIRQLTSNSFLASLANDDALGLYIETSLRPTAGAPDGMSSDPTTGIHNYLHGRFSDSTSAIDMGKPEFNLGNQRFWRLHGWIDSRWTAYRAAKGLPPEDSTLRSMIDAEKMHMNMSHPMHGMTAARTLESASRVSVAVPRSIASPFENTPQKRFMEAMKSSDAPKTIEELRDMVQLAIELEWFTLPPYLAAWWSIKSEPNPSPIVSTIVRSIAIQEMLHMAINCNLLVALGGKPKLLGADWFPKYPDFPPGIDLSQMVSLQPMSMDAVKLFMEIEKPAHDPITIPMIAMERAVSAPTIGDFYKLILDSLETLNPNFVASGQVTSSWFSELEVIDSLEKAKKAIGLIVEQGEGTTSSASEAGELSDELAHYYRFQQIVDGMEYVRQEDKSYKKDPSKPIAIPTGAEVYPMAIVPAGGYPGVAQSDRFDRLYTNMIEALQNAWDTGSSQALEGSIDIMYGLSEAARELMDTTLPSGSGNYGPAFLFNPPTPIAPIAPPSPSIAAMESFAMIDDSTSDGGDPIDTSLSGLCRVVGTGGVGESGATVMLIHTVVSHVQKLMVLRNVGTSLCPNQGAIAMLIVDGHPMVMDDITRRGSSIQVATNPGSRVIAIVHAIPLFNGISCIQQGELSVRLDECDFEFVALSSSEAVQSPPIPCTRNWFAWNDSQPCSPVAFHVTGEVEVPNPGVDVLLVPRTPQGFNPRILLLDLILVQSPGVWPQRVVYKQARYDRVGITYDAAQVFVGDQSIVNVDATPVS